MNINEIINRSEKNEFVKFKKICDHGDDCNIMNHLKAWAIFQFDLTLIRLDISEIERIDIDHDIETIYRDQYLFLLFPKSRSFSIIKNSFIMLYYTNGCFIDGTITGKITICPKSEKPNGWNRERMLCVCGFRDISSSNLRYSTIRASAIPMIYGSFSISISKNHLLNYIIFHTYYG